MTVDATMFSRFPAKHPEVMSIPWFTKVPAIPISEHTEDKQEKPDTALRFEPQAVKEPKHSVTDLSPEGESVSKRMSAFETNSIVCPGGKSECPDGMTCCKMRTGQWGCCSFPQAVCCKGESLKNFFLMLLFQKSQLAKKQF